MIVLDASAVEDWLLQTPAGKRIEQRIYARKDTLHTVYLLDVEFAQVLRRLVREGTLARKRAEEAIEDLIVVRVTRYAPSCSLTGSGNSDKV
jgi:predicted nucleic acid-binding protein